MDSAPRRPRVLLAGLFHETHCFVDEATPMADFQIRRGEALWEERGGSSPLSGFLEVAEEQQWEVVPAIDCRAMPSGTVRDEVVELFWTELSEAWNRHEEGFDAAFFVLHGAMVSESIPDVEGELLERWRALPDVERVPTVGVFDLHANVSRRMATHTDALVAYRENPHTDAREASVRAARLLVRILATGERSRVFHRATGLVWTPGRTATASDPMRSLEAMAREIEAASDQVWAANVAAGFCYADAPERGLSFQIVGTLAPPEAEAFLDRLEQSARALDQVETAGGEVSLNEAIALLRDQPLDGVTVLVEPSDNIGGGAPGDMTGLLRALVESEVDGVTISLNDPESVAMLQSRDVGDRVTLSVGGKGSALDAGPLSMEVELVSLSDGAFELEDKQSHLASVSGDRFDMGPCAVVRSGGITLLLTSVRTPPFDLAQWRSQGIIPESFKVIVVKAAVAHRRAYDPIAARMVWVDTPGPCTSRLETLPYRHPVQID